MSGIRLYIERRRAEIEAEITELQRELRDLSVAERALETREVPQSKSASSSTKDEGSELQEEPVRRKRSGPTIKELVMDVLQKQPKGGDVHQIIRYIADFHQTRVSRPSLSPQLTRLAREGRIAREGRRWFIPGDGGQAKEAVSSYKLEEASDLLGKTPER